MAVWRHSPQGPSSRGQDTEAGRPPPCVGRAGLLAPLESPRTRAGDGNNGGDPLPRRLGAGFTWGGGGVVSISVPGVPARSVGSHFTALCPLCRLKGLAQPGTWGVCASQSQLPCAHPPMTTQARPRSAGSQPWDRVRWGRSLWITPWDPVSPPRAAQAGEGTAAHPSSAMRAGPGAQGQGVGCRGGALEQSRAGRSWGTGEAGPALLGSSKRLGGPGRPCSQGHRPSQGALGSLWVRGVDAGRLQAAPI